MQSRCGGIFSLLASASCPEDSNPSTVPQNSLSLPLTLMSQNRKLHASHALSMDVILSRGLELGSHANDCWKHVFRYVIVIFIVCNSIKKSILVMNNILNNFLI